MNSSTLSAVLDTNVLYPTYLRDTLLQLAYYGLFDAKWTEEILKELERNLKKGKTILDSEQITLLLAMQTMFPEAPIVGYKGLIPQMENDPKDRHVAAAALHEGVPLIVTANLKDFQNLPEGIEAISPDTFLCQLLSMYPERVPSLIRKKLADYRNPPMTAPELLAKLARTVPAFAARMAEGLEGT